MLRQIFTLSFVVIAFLLVNAQSNDYTAVDQYALNAPDESSQDLYTLAYYLKGNGKFSEREKARSIYTWITHNIRYNHSVIEQKLLGTRENTLMQQPENVLAQRRAVCEGYANLYKSLANLMGLSAEIVTGKVRREDGVIPEIGHAWIAIRLSGEWSLSDPTWGAGYYDPDVDIHFPPADDLYFLVASATMIRDHYPYDPVWQLNRYPMTQAQWESWDLLSPTPQSNSTFPFFYADTILHMNMLDTLQRTLNTCARILRFNPNDDFALTQLGLKMYEQGLVSMVEIYQHLFSLESNPRAQLDTVRYFQQLQLVEQYFARAWAYLHAVKNERLQVIQQQMQPLEYLQAELIFVRGHVHYTQLSRYSRENLNNLNQSNVQAILRRIQLECERATNSYQQALNLYPQSTEEAIQKKRAEIVFFLARCFYLNTISHLNGSANRSSLGEESLTANLAAIIRGKNALLSMKQSIDISAGFSAESEGINEMRNDYPLLMAKLLANESLTRHDLVSLRYRLVFDNPLPYLESNFSTALDGYREAERRAVEGLKILSSSSNKSERQTIIQFLNAGGGLANIQIGAYQIQVAFKLHEKLVKNPSLGAKDKSEALSRIQKAQDAFVRAKPFLEKSGSNSNRMLIDLHSREAKLEELKKWWNGR
ncbi:MAG TPA: transglutaminase domain-containing protein [Haliscomenobacter sp.]|uniref:transglutaminase domain-containing protein n=1 Tax=Haliscomenobacter sp. TaxID=2717303 RepID=UPI002BA40FE7|nr:transglutaminase domain-containing protein [Haliscomenobacter sp.]HOY18676.1 transglutaminase domain-containing protein [Haliscomenobacter sp.]